METSTWLVQITEDSIREIAKRTGISERTLHHQVSNNKISLENIIKISVAYSHHPMSALTEWGYVGEEWADTPDIESALRMASEDQLADEVLRRMKVGTETDAFTTPVGDLAARRQTSPVSEDESMAASTAPLEPEEGDDDYHGGA